MAAVLLTRRFVQAIINIGWRVLFILFRAQMPWN